MPPSATAPTTRTSWPRFAGSLLVLLVILVGIPAGLIYLSQLAVNASHPIPGIASWDQITSWLSTQRSSTEVARVAVRILIVLCWLLWAALVSSLLSTIVASRPRFDGARLPRLAMFDSLGTWIVAGLMVVSSFHPKVATAAPIGPRPAVATVIGAPPGASPTTPRIVVQQAPRAGWAVVQSGESIETFATRTLGDPTRWTDVWELNRGRTMDATGTSWREPWRISAGWELQLPPHTSRSTIQAEAGIESPRVDPEAGVALATVDGVLDVHRVVAGDTLWDIVDDHYGHVDMPLVRLVAEYSSIADPNNIPIGTELQLPAEPAASEEPAPVVVDGALAAHRIVHGDTLWDIVDAQYGHVDMNLVWFVADFNSIADPNNIPIGTDIQLPPEPGTTLPAQVSTQPDPPVADLPVVSAPPPVTVSAPVVEASTPSPEPATTPTAPPPAPPPVGPAVPATSKAVGGRVGAATVVDDGGFDFSVRTLWWELVAGSLLTAGVVAMVRRLRGRRWLAVEPGEQLASPPSVVAGTELAAIATGASSRGATLTQLLRTVTPHAREIDDPPPVRAVEFSDDRVEVLFAAPAPFPPAGWATADGGRSWVHLLRGEAPTPLVRQLVTPALVTVGMRDGGGEVLLDVETAASTALVGDRIACLGLARSIVLELATYPLGVPIDVCLIGLDVDGVEHCDRAWGHTTLARAVRVAREMLERTNATDATSLVAARAAIDEDEGLLDPQIFVVDRAALGEADLTLLDELVSLCQPQAGASLILLGSHPAARETINLDQAGRASWSGASLTAPRVSREAAAQLAVTFEHAANAPIEPITVSPIVADLIDERADRPPTPATDSDERVSSEPDDNDDESEAVYVAPSADVVVRVMGEVTVIEGEVQLTADQTELLALLLCLRNERPNADTVATSLDGTRKSIQNRVSGLRARLGVGSDGRDLLPAAIVGRGSDGRYRPSPRMMTDVDLLEHRYRASLQLPSNDALTVLRDGLPLMSGPTFRSAKGYSWAAPEGVQARIAAVVNAYATRLMQLALEADALELVLETVRRAETVIDDVVAETPLHRVEREIADATGHPALREGVVSALRRLSAYVDETDHMVPTKP